MKKILFASLFLFACAGKPVQKPEPQGHASGNCGTFANLPAPQDFQSYDSDKSGEVTRAEFMCRAASRYQLLDKNNDNALSAPELKGKQSWSANADSSGDGIVSLDEFLVISDMAFELADRNKDEQLNQEEYLRAKALLP